MVLETLLRRVTCPNHASPRLLTVTGRGSYGHTRKVDLGPHPVVCLSLQVQDAEKFPHALGFESPGLSPSLLPRVSKQGLGFTVIQASDRV